VGKKGPREYRQYIGGEWVHSKSGEAFDVRSPASGEVLGRFPNGTREDVKAAVDAAVDAQDAVRSLSVAEREKIAVRITEEIRRHAEEFARDLSLEHGKPIREARPEVEDVIPNLLWQVEDLKRLSAPVVEGYSKPETVYMSRWEPLGTVGVITPWNFPWLLPGEFVVQAFLAGNTVVWKPASSTPISAVHLMECIDRAGAPPGAFNFVTGPGGEVGTALVEHPLVDAIGFTGETETGEDISRRAGLKKLTLELGGLGPLIIMDDANLPLAVEDLAFGCFTNTGHCCVANERVLVDERVHLRVVKALVDRVRKIKLGFPLEEDTTLGPIQNENTAHKVEEHVEEAVGKGAKVVLGGRRAKGFPTKLYYEPTVVDGVTTDMLFNKEETFGPVAPILEFSSLDEAIEIANEPRYGLSMAIHTNDLGTAMRAARELKSGQVCINEPVYSWDFHHPWGGFRRSGIGRIGGAWSLTAFMELKTIMFNVGRTRRA